MNVGSEARPFSQDHLHTKYHPQISSLSCCRSSHTWTILRSQELMLLYIQVYLFSLFIWMAQKFSKNTSALWKLGLLINLDACFQDVGSLTFLTRPNIFHNLSKSSIIHWCIKVFLKICFCFYSPFCFKINICL